MMIYYFSGTGNSLWAAKRIAHRFSAKLHGIMEYASDKCVTAEDTRIGFVFPTYMNDLPWAVKAFLAELKLKNPKYIFAVLTSSSGKSGKAAKSLDTALRAGGAQLSYVYNLPMPGNCIPGKAKKEKAKLLRAPEELEKIIREIKAGTVNVRRKAEKTKKEKENSQQRLKADFVTGPWFYKPSMAGNAMKPFPSDRCTGCGICGKVCPTSNIRIKEGRAVHGSCCAACYACYHWCPQKALDISMPVIRGRQQYHHPEIGWQDIAAQKERAIERDGKLL